MKPSRAAGRGSRLPLPLLADRRCFCFNEEANGSGGINALNRYPPRKVVIYLVDAAVRWESLMKTLLVLLGFLDPQPAIAETPDPQREIVVDWIEVNRLDNGYQKLDQVIFWRLRYDRHRRTYETVDCGWKRCEDVALIKIDHGWAVICERENTVWLSERIYWSHTDFDPELVYRESRFW